MKENVRMDVRIMKHSKKSWAIVDGTPIVNVELFKYTDDMTVYQAQQDKVSVVFEEKEGGIIITFKKGSEVVSTMSMDEFITKMM